MLPIPLIDKAMYVPDGQTECQYAELDMHLPAAWPVPTDLLFNGVADYHLSFRLRCDQRDLVFTDDLLFHTLELPKYAVPGDNELSALPGLEQWFCFLKSADQRDVRELARLLNDEVFSEAAGVLEMINQTPEDRQFYEARQKFLHDEEARLIAARAEAREEGRAEGMEKGMEKGRAEGAVQGELIGKIRILQEIVGNSVSSTAELLQRSVDELSQQVDELQKRLRSRGN